MTINGLLKGLQMDRWMSQLPDELMDVPLYNLAIPGSHNSITYCLDTSHASPVDLTQPVIVKKLDKYAKPVFRPFLYKWSVTQESTVLQQLDAGVRYFDLRIAHKLSDNSCNLYFYHGVHTTVTVEMVLNEISTWLEEHKREVVILSFSHFLCFNQQLHKHLIQLVQTVFHKRLCPRNGEVTLRNMTEHGHQLIVAYDHRDMTDLCDYLWDHIPYWWGNKCEAEALIQELERRKQCGRPGRFFVAGINLTVDAKHLILNPRQCLKDMVMQTYPVLLKWLVKQLPGSGHSSINIIAGDFVSDTQLAPTVITLNEALLNRMSSQ
ncbi:PI-PLC X domain-containing protein 1-like isoform X1 [Erpetoichthys calabaricus]|uniref:Phosphatidylinositol-specific phospholipase C, X domain containing 1 n=1 Tax=Erpetoichthys calabaricus TaxID=27687 RepID=A0A8C4SPU1_ERPCA|nr:PI-PLC X domain-containing protein 1-like isoform X1 [Erpetoichthys calabaricus]XP_051783054.1 PI-PLC X domain-containing protein 1-like isoform X1 [Erpetoichthys calabaricus]